MPSAGMWSSVSHLSKVLSVSLPTSGMQAVDLLLLLLKAGADLSQWPANLVGAELGPCKGGGAEGMPCCLGIKLE